MAKEQTNQETPVESPTPHTEPDAPEVFTRDQIRTAILDAKGEDEIVECFGIKVAVRTPALEDLLQYRNATSDDTIMARAIANNVYVPNTDERVFDEADIDGLMKSKFTPDMRKLNAAVTRVLGGDEQITQAVDNESKST